MSLPLELQAPAAAVKAGPAGCPVDEKAVRADLEAVVKEDPAAWAAAAMLS